MNNPLRFTCYNAEGKRSRALRAVDSETVEPLAALATLNALLRAGCAVEAISDQYGALLLHNPNPGANGCPDWDYATLEGIPEEQ